MEPRFPFVPRSVPTFYFIGVSTGKSSIVQVFPKWMQECGRPEVILEGIDLKIHAETEAYRRVVAQIKADPLSLGALITTHKIDLYQAAHDLFDELDPYARLCGELSCIAKQAGRLQGLARDPISAGLSMDALLGPSYFSRTSAEVLIFGAGGSAAAALLHLILKKDPADRPRRVTLVDLLPQRLEHVRQMVASAGQPFEVIYHCQSDPLENDRLLESLPPHSLVINATGMGKDTPGSPITSAARFPLSAVVWEFNYRGELDFLHQARAQQAVRGLKVEDGWLYFLHGWTQVILKVLHMELTPELFTRLERAAASVRG